MFKLSDGGDLSGKGLAITCSQGFWRDAFGCAGAKNSATGSGKGGACGLHRANFQRLQ